MLPQKETSHQTIARPLKVLVPLIQTDLKQGREAAARAALPYYQAAGEKLLEAKAQLKHGEFLPWVKRNFSVSIRMTHHYMNLAAEAAAQKGNPFPFSSLKEFIQQTSTPKPTPPNDSPSAAIMAEFRTEHYQLAQQLITTGYKVLAQKLHPDTGGSKDDMARLNAVRDHLKKANTGETISKVIAAQVNLSDVKTRYYELAKLLSSFDGLSADDQQAVLKTLEHTLTELRGRARRTS